MPRLSLAALAAAPALYLVSELIVPRDETTTAADELAFVAAHGGAFLAADLLALVAAAIFAVSVLPLVASVTGRGRTLTRVAGWLTVVGALALVGHAFLLLAVRDIAVVADPSVMAPANDTISEGVSAMTVLAARFFGFDLGLALLTIGLWRAGRLPAWLAPAGFLALVADFSPLSWNAVLMDAILLVAFGALAILTVRPARQPVAVPA